MNVREVDREVERRVGERLIDHLLNKTRKSRGVVNYNDLTWDKLADEMIQLSHWKQSSETNKLVLRIEYLDLYECIIDPVTFEPLIRKKT